MAFVNRIYVDSRHRIVDSESTSDFRIELPETMQMDDNMHVIVTDVVIPITWLTVEEDINDKLYVRLIEATSENITCTDYILKIPSRNYNRQELAEAISDVCEARGLPLRANDDPFRNLIRIFLPADSQLQFMVFSEKDLDTKANVTWTGPYYTSANPQSINNIIGNSLFRMKTYDAANIFEGGSYNGVPHHTIYLVCPQLGNRSSVGPLGERDILKKVVITDDQLTIPTNLYLNPEDHGDVSRRTFKSLNFKLTDVYGNTVPLHGQNISFTLVFCKDTY
jgi:hypothetical protein